MLYARDINYENLESLKLTCLTKLMSSVWELYFCCKEGPSRKVRVPTDMPTMPKYIAQQYMST